MITRKYHAIAICWVLSAIVSVSAVQAELLNVNLLTNGSFESSPLSTKTGIIGWGTFPFPTGIIDGQTHPGGPTYAGSTFNDTFVVRPQEGIREARIEGTGALSFEQSVTLDGGINSYTLSAWFTSNNTANNVLSSFDISLELRTSGGSVITPVGSSSPGFPRIAGGGTTGNWANWTREYRGLAAGNYIVRAAKGSTPNFAMGWVDNVSLVAVPEPSLAMPGGVGLLSLILMHRASRSRRRGSTGTGITGC